MDINVFDGYREGTSVAELTSAIQSAIDRVSEAGGGKVTLDRPGEYLLNGLNLRSKVNFVIGKGVTIKASGDESTYTHRPGPFEFLRAQTPICAFIFTQHCHDVTISGEGAIDGNYRLYLADEQEDLTHLTFTKYPRPMGCYFEDCRNTRIEGVTFQNMPFWTVHLVGCVDTVATGVNIANDVAMPNTDGFDVDRCRNTLIEHCTIVGGDDGVCPKTTEETARYGNCVNLHVRDCRIRSTSSAIKFGSSSFGDFENFTFEDLTIEATNRALGVQVRDTGAVRNVAFRRIHLSTHDYGARWWGAGEPIYVTINARSDADDVSSCRIENVIFSDITGDADNGIIVYAPDPKQIRNVIIENVHLDLHPANPNRLVFDMRPCEESRRDLIAPVQALTLNGVDVEARDVELRVTERATA